MKELNLPLETKVVPDHAEIDAAYGGFMHSFEAFKEANDRRLQEIERRMTADVVTEEKVERLNRAVAEHKSRLDELAIKGRRPPLDRGSPHGSCEVSEHKQAFALYMRRGEATGLVDLEAKSLTSGSGPDGGYLVPEETETEIGRLLRQASPLRAVATVRHISAAVYKKPFAIAGAATGWVGETAARPETAGPSLAELQFPAMEIYAMPAATQTLLDDAAVDIDRWIAEEVQAAFAEQETEAFVNGDGVARPRGFLNYPKTADGGWTWSNVGYVATGAAAGFAPAAPADVLLNIIYAVKAGYRQGASFVMNRRTQNEIRKIKNADGDYLWQPAAAAGAPASLLGFPIVEAEAMPSIAPDAFPLAFGDFRSFYLIVDRLGVRILRDPYSAKPYVLFYTTKRVGGGVQNFEAAKLLKIAA